MTNYFLVRKIKLCSEWKVYGALAVLLIAVEIMTPGYLQVNNLSNVMRQAAFLGIVAAGQTMVILTGGTDLSVSYLVTMGNLIGAQIMAGQNGNMIQALAAVILIGAIVGVVNGVGTAFLQIPSLVMTLGTGSVLQGLAYLYTKGAPKGSAAPLIKWMVSGNGAGSMSFLILLWLTLSGGMILMLAKSVFGRYIYAVGENGVAAEYSGVPVKGTLLSVYALSGIFSCITGYLLVGYTGTSYLEAGTEYQMNSIAAVVIGGTLLSGGYGGYLGTIGGTFILAVLLNVMNIVNVPTYGKEMIRGLIMIIILVLYSFQKKKR